MKIFKWPLDITGEQVLDMPAGAQILDVQVQHHEVHLWAMCDTRQPIEQRRITIYGTGHVMPEQPGKYLATFQLGHGAQVFHVFAPASNPFNL